MNRLKQHIDKATRINDTSDDARLFVALLKNSGEALVSLSKQIRNDLKSGNNHNVYAECHEAMDFGKSAFEDARELMQKLNSGKLKNIEKL